MIVVSLIKKLSRCIFLVEGILHGSTDGVLDYGREMVTNLFHGIKIVECYLCFVLYSSLL